MELHCKIGSTEQITQFDTPRQNVRVKLPKLCKSSLRIIGYSNVALANNQRSTSHVRYEIYLGDYCDKVLPVFFWDTKRDVLLVLH